MPDLPPPTPIGLTPYLTIRGSHGADALAFYARAFDAKEVFRNIAVDGKRLMHARIEINGDILMLSDDFPETRGGVETPPPAAVTLHLQVDDADAWAERAAAAGAEIVMPIADMPWGDRYGHIRDPFGYVWSLGSSKSRDATGR